MSECQIEIISIVEAGGRLKTAAEVGKEYLHVEHTRVYAMHKLTPTYGRPVLSVEEARSFPRVLVSTDSLFLHFLLL